MDIQSLVDNLNMENGVAREKIREALVALGRPAVPFLIKALWHSDSEQVRWEAAKAFVHLVDARAALVLVKALEDEDRDVSWLAAEALIRLGKAAWPPLLRALKNRPDSYDLRRGAHHVFATQKRFMGKLVLGDILKALEGNAPKESVRVAANLTLKRAGKVRMKAAEC